MSHKTCGMRGLQLGRQTPNRKAPSSFVRDCHTDRHTQHRTAVSESSYLPFLFHAEGKVSPSFNGRRSFVKGKEVVPVCFTFLSYSAMCDRTTNPRSHSTSSQQPEPVQSSDPPHPTVSKLEPGSASGGSGASHNHRDDGSIKPKREKKPVSISGFKSPPSLTSPTSKPLSKKPALPASDLIYQDADVGVDLGSTRRAVKDRTSFIKPAGVDAPPRDSQLARKPTALPFVESARAQVEQKKRPIDGSGSCTQPANGSGEDSSRKKRKR